MKYKYLLAKSTHRPTTSLVLRTLWQIKSLKAPQGNEVNAGPDLQQLVLEAHLVV